MKIEIEKREYDRLKSREEKLLAYYEWRREGEGMELKSIEEVINDNIRLRNENKKLRNSLNMKDGTIVGLQHRVQELEEELNKIKKRVKEHTTYSVKAEFIKKFGDIYVYDAKQVRDVC